MQNQSSDLVKGKNGSQLQPGKHSKRNAVVVVALALAVMAFVFVSGLDRSQEIVTTFPIVGTSGSTLSAGSNQPERANTQLSPQVAAERNAAITSAAPRPGDATYTDRYWEQAAEMNAPVVPQVNPLPESYTQKYWDYEAERVERNSAMTSAAPRPEDATYTDMFWELAAEMDALNVPQSNPILESKMQEYWESPRGLRASPR